MGPPIFFSFLAPEAIKLEKEPYYTWSKKQSNINIEFCYKTAHPDHLTVTQTADNPTHAQLSFNFSSLKISRGKYQAFKENLYCERGQNKQKF